MKLGCLPYLNVKPLVYTLERGGLPCGWELVYAPPAELAQMLLREEIVAAPVSSYAVLAHKLDYVPRICIASDGPVRSVIMLSKLEAKNLHTLALDSGSLSGANMLQIILREVYGVSPKIMRMPASSVEQMLQICDAALMIGNPAMLCSRNGLFVLDVAEEWRRLTGLPAVFALWAGKQIPPELAAVLTDAKSDGLSRIPEIARVESAKLGLAYEVCLEYLSSTISYDLGEREQMSLHVFEQKLLAHVLLDAEAVVA